MTSAILLKLEMVLRALGFCRANPIPGDPAEPTVARLEDRIKRADDLKVQQESGRQAARTAARRRGGILRTLWNRPLRLLAGIAEAAAVEVPELAGVIVVPALDGKQAEFITATRTIMEAVTARKDLFLRYGMPATLLDDIAALLAEYDVATADGHAARRAHTGARAEMRAITEELMGLIDHLDSLNSYHFHDSPEQLAAWISARNIAWPRHRPADPPTDTQSNPAA